MTRDQNNRLAANHRLSYLGHQLPINSRSDKLNSRLVLGNANAHHAHHARNLPIFLAGGGFKHGHYVARARNKNTPLSNLFVTMLNNAGLETESFGQSRGSLTW